MGKSELDWTIVRPGGLREGPSVGNIVYGPADSLFGGSIAREQVAAVAAEAVVNAKASRKVIEIIASEAAAPLSFDEGFEAV